MATTSLLYHAFGLKSYNIIGTKYKDGKTFLHIEMKKFKRKCAICGSRKIVKAGRFIRTIKAVPIGRRSTYFASWSSAKV